MEANREVEPTFNVITVNHKKAPLDIRTAFHLSEEKIQSFLQQAKKLGIKDLFVLVTCNRSEVYAYIHRPEILKLLFMNHTGVNKVFFDQNTTHLSGEQGILHLFRTSTGLEAQVLGDVQIMGQVKAAFEQSEKMGLVSGAFQRMMQYVARANKKIQTHTSLSKGGPSIAYAATLHICKYIEGFRDCRILLFGTGSIGQIMCKNLLKHGIQNVCVINRTHQKAQKVAKKFGLDVAKHEELPNEIKNADVIIVATGGSTRPTLTEEAFTDKKDHRQQLVVDLGIPRNTDVQLDRRANLKIIHMDHLKDDQDSTLTERQRAIPFAEQYIQEEIETFVKWLRNRKVVPAIKFINETLEDIRCREIETHCRHLSEHEREHLEMVTKSIVKKICHGPICHLRAHTHSTDELSALVYKLFSPPTSREPS